ncbi:MAG: class I SAM-dependent methyltransferase, partial [Actinobacteria bacterium]|nr:class I SAM-dependent methyltransferase [Actinomycetota bacterium]
MTDMGCPEPGTGAPADRGIDWTGERCVPWTDDLQVIYEHYHRYALAARYVAGARVLDLGCGEGFGPALLAGVAREVVGVDIDRQTIEHAVAHYPRENLSFSVGSMIDPDLHPAAEPFDVITCFEALEHVEEQDVLIALVRRLLTPGGLFLTSTPDVTVYTHQHGNENPFHLRELSEPEFRELLGGAFGHVALLRQNVAVGSLIAAEPAEQGQLLPYVGQSLRRSPHGGWQLADELPHTYLLGMASDAPLPELAGLSALVDPELTLVRDAHRALGRERHRADQAGNALADERNRAAADQASAVRRLERLGGEVHQLRTDLAGAARRAERAESRAAWQQEIAGVAERRAAELDAEVQTLRAEQSAVVQRLLSRYRGVVERAAPRGTVRRDVYERALGRRPGAHSQLPAAGVVQVCTSSTPVVSIIVPVHGKWDYTQR